MLPYHPMPPARPRLVRLNVGGTVFTTTESTLTKESRYFAALLSGEYNDRQGDEVFVDRDPAHFAAVLQYLRGGLASVPSNLTPAGFVASRLKPAPAGTCPFAQPC